MTGSAILYLCMSATLAAIVVLYAAHVVRVVGDTSFDARRAWKLLPGVSSAIVWRDGARVLPVALVVAMLFYASLWLFLAT